jgi:uncharacterized Ntn-hydrolase superfamily protein
MKRQIIRSIFAIAAGLTLLPLTAHATWSIVAVDPNTGDVGVAGATCGPDVVVIAGAVPGKGALVAQGMTSFPARAHGLRLLQADKAAPAILAEMRSSRVDKAWYPIRQLRQFGVASLLGHEASTASFTGAFTGKRRGVRAAPGVSVQGNVLASTAVLDKTLSAFQNTQPSCGLALALLNAMEAGARAGGDKRCKPEQSALSAFLIVARRGDALDKPSIHIVPKNQNKHGENPVLQLREPLLQALEALAAPSADCLR